VRPGAARPGPGQGAVSGAAVDNGGLLQGHGDLVEEADQQPPQQGSGYQHVGDADGEVGSQKPHEAEREIPGDDEADARRHPNYEEMIVLFIIRGGPARPRMW